MLKVVRIQPVSNDVLQITIDKDSHVAPSKRTTLFRDFIRENLLEKSPNVPVLYLYSKFVSYSHMSLISKKKTFRIEILWAYYKDSMLIFVAFFPNWRNCSSRL